MTDKDVGLAVRFDGVALSEARVDRCRASFLREHPAVLALYARGDRLRSALFGVERILGKVEKHLALAPNFRLRAAAPTLVSDEIKQLDAGWDRAIAELGPTRRCRSKFGARPHERAGPFVSSG